MMKFVFRVKHYDVLITNRTENMTLVDCISQLVDESEVNRKKGDPQLKKVTMNRRKTVILENSSLKQFQNRYLSLVIIKTLSKFRSLNYHSIFVLLLMFHS